MGEVIIIMATVIIMAIATVMEALEIITREDMEVIMITLDTAVVIEITTMVLGIIVMEVMDTVMVVMMADIMVMITLVALIMIIVLVVTVVVVTAVVDTAERKDLCTIDLCTILWFMELKATMVKDSKHLPNMQPWDLGHIVEPVAGEDFLVSGDTPTTVSPGLEVCFTTRSLTIMPIIWQIFLASTATNLNIIKF